MQRQQHRSRNIHRKLPFFLLFESGKMKLINQPQIVVSPLPEATGPSSNDISPDGSCGATEGYTCTNSVYGPCCSQYGYCGSTPSYCAPASGCQSLFGTCVVPSGPVISQDGSCGGTLGYFCSGSVYGDCCSQYGWCGSSAGYCEAGCLGQYGTCTGGAGSSVSSSVVEPGSTGGSQVSMALATSSLSASAAPTSSA
jgi:hypothetical protein